MKRPSDGEWNIRSFLSDDCTDYYKITAKLKLQLRTSKIYRKAQDLGLALQSVHGNSRKPQEFVFHCRAYKELLGTAMGLQDFVYLVN